MKSFSIIKCALLALLCAGCVSCMTVCPVNGRTSVTDDDITTNVQTRIYSDRGLNYQSIHVTTYERVVTLNGFVANPTQVCIARKLAQSVPHVKRVVSHLNIRQVKY